MPHTASKQPTVGGGDATMHDGGGGGGGERGCKYGGCRKAISHPSQQRWGSISKVREKKPDGQNLMLIALSFRDFRGRAKETEGGGVLMKILGNC